MIKMLQYFLEIIETYYLSTTMPGTEYVQNDDLPN